jgi:hypothetical protein
MCTAICCSSVAVTFGLDDCGLLIGWGGATATRPLLGHTQSSVNWVPSSLTPLRYNRVADQLPAIGAVNLQHSESVPEMKIVSILPISYKGKGHPITDHEGPRSGVEV